MENKCGSEGRHEPKTKQKLYELHGMISLYLHVCDAESVCVAGNMYVSGELMYVCASQPAICRFLSTHTPPTEVRFYCVSWCAGGRECSSPDGGAEHD